MARSNEVEETLKRINSHKGVLGVVILNSDGIPIRTTLERQDSVQYASLVSQFVSKSRSVVRQLDESNELQFVRIRSLRHEIMVATDREYTLIIIQDPS